MLKRELQYVHVSMKEKRIQSMTTKNKLPKRKTACQNKMNQKTKTNRKKENKPQKRQIITSPKQLSQI